MKSGEFLSRSGIRMRDPGVLYNLGNSLGFGVGIAVALSVDVSEPEAATLWSRAMAHIAGSPAAAALTVATAVFFWGGIDYMRAWSNGAPPDPKLNQRGDVLSGVGAIVLGIGLVLLGDPWLAASAGALHAIGKFGSAVESTAIGQKALAHRRVTAFCKDLVLMSRVPAILAGTTALWRELALFESVHGVLLSFSFVACCLIWAAADWMLLSPQGWIRPLGERYFRAQ